MWNISFKSYVYYLVFLLLVSFIFVSYILSLAPIPQDFRSFLYVFGIYGYFGILVLIFFSISFIFAKILRPFIYVIPLLGTLWIFYLIADALVFKMYGFALNMLLIKMFILDFKGMGLPSFVLLLIVFLSITLVAINFALFYFLSKYKSRNGTKFIVFISLLLFVALFINSMINIWANFYNRAEILVYKRYFPIYYPLTSHKKAKKLSKYMPYFFPNIKGDATSNQSVSSKISYPKKTMTCKADENSLNIVLIVLESWQKETANEKNMPNLIKRVKKAGTFYNQHISNGTATIPGLFSLFTGVYGSYYKSFSSNPHKNSSVLIKELQKQDYQIYNFTSSNLRRFNLKPMILPNIKEKNYFKTKSDEETFLKIKENLEKRRNDEKFMDFIFYVSSHSSYDYPKEYEKFKPTPKVEGSFLLDSNTDNTVYKNDYKNSLFYLDDLIEKTLNVYEKKGLLENTYIIITGDHAEEFNENKKGFWGHGSNFSKWQDLVPLIVIKANDTKYNVVNKTSFHIDLAPTLLQDVLSCKNELGDYTNGINLKNISKNRDTIISSYYEDAYLIDNTIYEKNTGRVYKWEDMKEVDNKLPNIKAYKKLLKGQREFDVNP